MQYEEGKRQFIQTWGKLGGEWGINRTMAQVHALLLISPRPLSTEQVMEELSISRGNANMNLRDLLDWNLVHKELVPGDRKEYFVAEKDIWEVAKRIARERSGGRSNPSSRCSNGSRPWKATPTARSTRIYRTHGPAQRLRGQDGQLVRYAAAGRRKLVFRHPAQTHEVAFLFACMFQ
jgi:hypothetical protein